MLPLMFCILFNFIAKIIQTVQLFLLEMNFIHCFSAQPRKHLHLFFIGIIFRYDKTHILFYFFICKANIMQRHNQTEPLYISIIILPCSHDRLDCTAQSPRLIFFQYFNTMLFARQRNIISKNIILRTAPDPSGILLQDDRC